MAKRSDLEKAAAAVGAEIDWHDYDLNVDTPRGYVWRSNGCSTIAVPFANPGADSWKPKAYDEALDLMAHGIEPAENADDPDAGYQRDGALSGLMHAYTGCTDETPEQERTRHMAMQLAMADYDRRSVYVALCPPKAA
jgi:hypothetical protein